MSAPAAAPNWPTQPCEGCGAQVVWALTINARPMPVDPNPVPDGNVVLSRVGGGIRAEVVRNPARLFGKRVYRSHFSSCPKAADYRRPRGRR